MRWPSHKRGFLVLNCERNSYVAPMLLWVLSSRYFEGNFNRLYKECVIIPHNMAEREPLSGFETVGEAKDARRSTAEGELTSDVDRARFKIDTHLSGVDLPEDLSHEIRERELEARHLSFADFTDITEALHFSLGKPSSGGRWQECGLMQETIRQRKNEKPGYKRNWSEAGNLFTTL